MEYIYPLELTTTHKALLYALLKQADENQDVFKAGTPHIVQIKNSKTKQLENVAVTLTHTIYKRPREHRRHQVRYEIIHEDKKNPFNVGGRSFIYITDGTLKLKRTGLKLDTKKRISKAETHPLVDEDGEPFTDENDNPLEPDDVKIEIINKIYNEINFANRAGKAHMKYPALTINDNSTELTSYVTMRLKKGREVFGLINEEHDEDPYEYKIEPKLTTHQRLTLSLNALRSLHSLHKHKVIHRDIKPENMIVNIEKGCEVAIIDFGYSKLKKNNDTTRLGTPGYISPEVMNHEIADEKSDVYSLGIAMSLVWGGEDPDPEERAGNANYLDTAAFNEPNFNMLFSHIKTDLTDGEQEALKTIIKDMTATNRDKRLSVKEAIREFKAFLHQYEHNHPKKTSGRSHLPFFKRRKANEGAIEKIEKKRRSNNKAG